MNLYRIYFNRSTGNIDTEVSICVISADVESAINLLRKNDPYVNKIDSIAIQARDIDNFLTEDSK